MYITRGKKDMSANSRNRTEYEISKARRRFAIIFLAAVVATAGMISFIITKQAVDNMRSKILNLISSNNQQLGYNVDNYLVGIEDTVALFFSDDQLCEYDATDDSLDEFTRIQQEAAIQNRISDLGVFDNFTDFGVVVSYIGESEIFKEVGRLKLYSFVATLVLALLVVVTGSIVLKRIYTPVSGAIEELKQKAEYDQLTGLMNKASFGEVVGSCLEEKSETVTHVFIMIDMDNFKKVNDTLGHGEGDVVLSKTAELFTKMLGADSVIGRVGGDEFAVYRKFTGWTLESVRKKMEFELRLLAEDFTRTISKQYTECNLSLSAGVYIVDGENSSDYESMMKKADTALYKSKRNGKSQYSWFVENQD